MSNNLIREQHLASVQSAVKNYVDKKISAGGNILDTVPATVDGGLWYALEDSKPVIKFFHDNNLYKISPEVVVRTQPTLSVSQKNLAIMTGSFATCSVTYDGDGQITTLNVPPSFNVVVNGNTITVNVADSATPGNYSFRVSATAGLQSRAAEPVVVTVTVMGGAIAPE